MEISDKIEKKMEAKPPTRGLRVDHPSLLEEWKIVCLPVALVHVVCM